MSCIGRSHEHPDAMNGIGRVNQIFFSSALHVQLRRAQVADAFATVAQMQLNKKHLQHWPTSSLDILVAIFASGPLSGVWGGGFGMLPLYSTYCIQSLIQRWDC